MAPQRRASANKRPQQHTSQSTQCGIHRFFSPHSCGGIASTSPAVELDMKPMTPLSGTAAHSKLAVPAGSRLRVPAENQRQRKMMKISPTSLIQPSQDDGVGDQVEWRLSPMADRLHEASTDIGQHPLPVLNSKKSSSLPNVQDLFKNSSSTSCSGPVLMRKKKSPSLAGKLEQWLSASNTAQKSNAGAVKPTAMGAAILLEQSLDWYQQTPNVQEKENIMVAFHSSGPGTDFNTQKSPKGTGNMAQSSLHCHSLAKKTHKRKGKQRASGQRRKALLELLDQVQNVMSDPESSFAEEDTSCLEDRKTVKSVDSCERKYSAKTSVEIASNNFDNDSKQIAKCSSIPLTKGDICMGFYKKDSSISGGLPKTTHDCVDDKSNDEDAISDHSNLEDEDSAIPQALAGIHFLVLEVADMVDGVDGNTLPKKVLRLLNEYSGLERILYLVDEWYYTVVRPGDTVNVIGDFDVDGKCVIDRDNNLLIVHPDVLISGSKVGSSFSCPRRAVLDERIRSNSVAFPALLGTMIHELFQVALRDRVTSRLVLEQEAESLVHHHIDSLFACGGNEKDALIKLRESIPTILNWLDSFFHASSSAIPKVDFGRKEGHLSVSVTEVVDIEEMIYSPKFGLKGMIDASLLVKLDSLSLGCREQVLPLEFKTGKLTTGQAALEHRAQVILYTLLMSDRYMESIDSGLLYYLHTNQTQGVSMQRADVLGLVMRRNEHAKNLLAASSAQQLPPMLQSLHLCQRCWHVDACSIYHKAQEGGTSDSSGLGELFNQLTDHLNSSHIDFIKFWDQLIDLEAQDLQASQREIWRLPAKEREKSGHCLSRMRLNLELAESDKDQKDFGRFIYHFSRDKLHFTPAKRNSQDYDGTTLHKQIFTGGEHVLLSTESGHVAVAAGSICDIKKDTVSIKLSHPLRLPQKIGVSNEEVLCNETWRIDKDETASFLASMRFNLLNLFLKGGHEQGRRLIVDLEPPRFDSGGLFSQDPAAMYVRSATNLNEDQRRAIFKILSSQDYTLVLGMPGTGKTSTIVHAVNALLTRGASILLTSYTNSAVDNILLRLKEEGVDFVRLGRENAVHSDLKDHMVDDLRTVQDLEARMNTVNVIAVTCLGVSHPLLINRKFDICIVDEAGQITLPVCLGALRFADKFVLVGDHYQLPPLVRNVEARDRGLAVSLFRRLSEAHPQSIAALQCQYRMSAGIMKLCNTLIYGNRLRCGSHNVANGQLIYNTCISDVRPSWLQKVLDPLNSAVFVNTDMLNVLEVSSRSTTYNMTEATIVVMILKQLKRLGVDLKDIGIISPYNYQVQRIRHLLCADELAVLEIHTIDRFQGRDKECVLVSFVKSSTQSRGSSTLLADWHRINVAITRAKKKLILIGSRKALSSTPVLKLLITQVDEMRGCIDIPNNSNILSSGLRICGPEA